MDALADVLSAARLGGAVFARTTPRAPWGLAFDAAPMADFHLVVRGSCYLKLESAADPVELHQGDLALVCHGSPHMISNPERARPTPFGQILARHVDPAADLVFGGDGATSTRPRPAATAASTAAPETVAGVSVGFVWRTALRPGSGVHVRCAGQA